MELPRSTFYAASTPTPKRLKDEELARKIAEIQQEFFFTIGRRRMGALLHKRFGLKVCETTLQRVMSRYGLSARIRQVRKAKPCAGKATKASLPSNLLNRTFEPAHPMHRMVTDGTYVPYFEDGEWHWGYLSLVQDLFDRPIVAWVFSRRQDTRLGLATLQLLSQRDIAEGAMLHSDRGSIYMAQVFRDTVESMGMTHSFSRTANCHDNATMECFNGTFKVEALYNPLWRLERPSFKEQNDLIGRYIEFYNNKRPCSVIGNLAPAECRLRFGASVLQSSSASASGSSGQACSAS